MSLNTATLEPLDEAQTARARRRNITRMGRALLGVALLAAWYVGWRTSGPYIMASPGEVLRRLGEIAASGVLLTHIIATAKAATLGFFVGLALGLSIPMLLRMSNRATDAIEPYIMTSMGIPIFALAPLLVLWFGIDLTPKVVLTAATVFYIIFIATMSGLRAVDGRLVTMARIVGAGQGVMIREVYWKSIQPFLYAGLRVALPRAIGATIVGEFLVAYEGVGFYIEDARQQADVIGVFTGIVVVTAIVVGLDILLERIYRRALSWRPIDSQMTT